MMESALKVWGVFWLYGGLSAIGFIYLLLFMKETRGLTDKEKKNIYNQ